MNFWKNLNLPNKLTLIRVAMIPFFVVAVMLSADSVGWKVAALIIFIAASLTDTLDGYIARSRNLVTNFGKFADPLADKLLVCSALICFVGLGTLPAWVCIIIMSREFIISGFRLIAAEKGIVIAASKWGKAKTISQMITCCLLILNQEHIAWLNITFIVIMTILTVISLVDYIIKNKDVLKD